MAVTLKQIAECAGVSRSTVDRALNNRGRIDSAVAEQIRTLASEMGYRPNRAGRMLAMTRKPIRISVIVVCSETPFAQMVIKSAKQAQKELEEFGAEVMVEGVPGQGEQTLLCAIQSMRKKGCNAFVFAMGHGLALQKTVNELSEKGFPVISITSDDPNAHRLCYVGQNLFQSGKVAAGLMADIAPANGEIMVFSSIIESSAHEKRISGFQQELKKKRPDLKLLPTRYTYDNNQEAEETMSHILLEHPNIRGIYLAGEGVGGVCSALRKTGLSGRVKVISNDITSQNKKLLKQGEINYLIDQDAYTQGHEPPFILFNYLINGKTPEKELLYTEIRIMSRYNI